MRLSINWLNKFLSLDDLTPEEVASKLTMGAFEVEEVHKLGSNLKGPIVVGKILDIQKHPNADKLSVTRVTTDGKNQLQIVCGATNIKVGQLIPVSLPGAVVENRQDGSELAIKTTKIRGIESFGMLCSAGELGIKNLDPNGILILPTGAKLGQNVIDYLSLTGDTVLEVASRSNRGDALSVYGLGKEISALTKKSLKEIDFKEPKIDKSMENVGSKIENLNDTYLFYTVTIEDINVSESPLWLKKLLDSVEIRSINNIVDITNYINFSFGQPLHAYDRAKLSLSNKRFLTARLAKNGEEIITIDDKKRELKEGILVIADEEKPVAIAGIMGGKDSEVTNSTKDIVLEAAVFNPVKVRRGSRNIGLSSEASKRFERGVDSNFTFRTLLKAIELVEELAASNNKKPKVGQIQQAGEPIKEEIKIYLTPKDVRRVLGIDLKVKEITNLLELLQFKTKPLKKEDSIEVLVPLSRTHDVTRTIDLIEEVARLYGYDQIPVEPPLATIAATKSFNNVEKIKSDFLSAGFSETYLSSLIGEVILSYKEFTFNNLNSVNMVNPLSKEHSALRQSLIPGLLEALKLNQSHQNNSVKLFEVGKVYFFNKGKALSERETGTSEILKLAGVISGYEENWFTNKNLFEKLSELLFFSVKGILESLFTKNNELTFIKCKEEFLHPSFAFKLLLNNNEFGLMGCLHPKVEKKHKLLGQAVIFEISLEPILNELEKTKTFEKISSQPLVERDITINLPKKHSASIVKAEIDKITSNFVTNVNLVSVYELDKENRSLTYRLKMQDLEQTLTSKQIEDEVNKIKKHLTACLQAKFRV